MKIATNIEDVLFNKEAKQELRRKEDKKALIIIASTIAITTLYMLWQVFIR